MGEKLSESGVVGNELDPKKFTLETIGSLPELGKYGTEQMRKYSIDETYVKEFKRFSTIQKVPENKSILEAIPQQIDYARILTNADIYTRLKEKNSLGTLSQEVQQQLESEFNKAETYKKLLKIADFSIQGGEYEKSYLTDLNLFGQKITGMLELKNSEGKKMIDESLVYLKQLDGVEYTKTYQKFDLILSNSAISERLLKTGISKEAMIQCLTIVTLVQKLESVNFSMSNNSIKEMFKKLNGGNIMSEYIQLFARDTDGKSNEFVLRQLQLGLPLMSVSLKLPEKFSPVIDRVSVSNVVAPSKIPISEVRRDQGKPKRNVETSVRIEQKNPTFAGSANARKSIEMKATARLSQSDQGSVDRATLKQAGFSEHEIAELHDMPLAPHNDISNVSAVEGEEVKRENKENKESKVNGKVDIFPIIKDEFINQCQDSYISVVSGLSGPYGEIFKKNGPVEMGFNANGEFEQKFMLAPQMKGALKLDMNGRCSISNPFIDETNGYSYGMKEYIGMSIPSIDDYLTMYNKDMVNDILKGAKSAKGGSMKEKIKNSFSTVMKTKLEKKMNEFTNSLKVYKKDAESMFNVITNASHLGKFCYPKSSLEKYFTGFSTVNSTFLDKNVNKDSYDFLSIMNKTLAENAKEKPYLNDQFSQDFQKVHEFYDGNKYKSYNYRDVVEGLTADEQRKKPEPVAKWLNLFTLGEEGNPFNPKRVDVKKFHMFVESISLKKKYKDSDKTKQFKERENKTKQKNENIKASNADSLLDRALNEI